MAAHLGRHGLAELVGQHPSRFVLHVQVAGEGQGGLALDLVAEDHDRREVGLQGQLVEGEQGAGREAEILAARLAAEPEVAGWAAGLVAGRATAMRADGLAVRLNPADRGEGGLGLAVRQAQHGHQGDGAGLGGEEKVTSHLSDPLAYRQICKLTHGALQEASRRLC